MKEDLNPMTFANLVKETFSLVILRQTLWLVPSMLAAGFYFTMYCVEVMYSNIYCTLYTMYFLELCIVYILYTVYYVLSGGYV